MPDAALIAFLFGVAIGSIIGGAAGVGFILIHMRR